MLSSFSSLLAAETPEPAYPEVRAGRARASWMAASATFTAGKPIHTAIRVTMDPSWHTYWVNPGEGGMRFSVDHDFPTGWQASEIQFPAPISFESAGLKVFGYEGTVWLPLTLTPPSDAAAEAPLKLTVNWLACDDSSCIPGKATLSLVLTPGEPRPTAAADAIQHALDTLPSENHPFKLHAKLDEDRWHLEITSQTPNEPNLPLDPATAEVFPETPGVIDEGAEAVRFTKTTDRWTATAIKSPYLKQRSPWSLVLVDHAKQRAIRLTCDE